MRHGRRHCPHRRQRHRATANEKLLLFSYSCQFFRPSRKLSKLHVILTFRLLRKHTLILATYKLILRFFSFMQLRTQLRYFIVTFVLVTAPNAAPAQCSFWGAKTRIAMGETKTKRSELFNRSSKSVWFKLD